MSHLVTFGAAVKLRRPPTTLWNKWYISNNVAIIHVSIMKINWRYISLAQTNDANSWISANFAIELRFFFTDTLISTTYYIISIIPRLCRIIITIIFSYMHFCTLAHTHPRLIYSGNLMLNSKCTCVAVGFLQAIDKGQWWKTSSLCDTLKTVQFRLIIRTNSVR